MAFLQNKIDISTFFLTNWTTTPIHWSGNDFNITGVSEWIFLEVKPKRSSAQSLNNDGKYNEEMLINCIIYSKSEIRSIELFDKLQLMLSINNIEEMSIKTISLDNKGILKTDRGDFSYLDLAITLKSY